MPSGSGGSFHASPQKRRHSSSGSSTKSEPSMVEVSDYLRPLMLKDLRVQCRARGLNPGGGREALAERLGEHMLATQDFTIFADANPSTGSSSEIGSGSTVGGTFAASMDDPSNNNNYSRPEGQNVGNHITDRPSSRVLAPPGGASQVHFGASPPRQAPQPALADLSNQDVRSAPVREMAPKSPAGRDQNQSSAASLMYPSGGSPQGHFSGHGMSGGAGVEVNNYSRPGGQNVGNFLSDRPSSRVTAPPGGASQVFFG